MTDIPWGSDEAKAFITNVGLITTTGKAGDNVMSAEWTHQISYSPGLIAVCVNKMNLATALNIKESKQFGVNMASTDQNVVASIAGNSHGNAVDKINVLKEMGFKFTKAKHIESPMVEGAVLQVECKLIREIDDIGSHTIFIGEALSVELNKTKQPLAYHKGKYFKLNEVIPKPQEAEVKKIKELVEKNTR